MGKSGAEEMYEHQGHKTFGVEKRPSESSECITWICEFCNFDGISAEVNLSQFECGHFRKANEWLKEKYGEEGVINWDLNVAPEVAGV